MLDSEQYDFTKPDLDENEMPTTEIVMPWLVHEKIMHWVQLGNSHECSGLGVTKIIEGKIHIVDAIMLKQSNAGATTDIDEQEVNRAMFKFHKQGISGDLNFWWHSHADMPVFWSGTDRETIAQIGKHGMCVAVVFNKKRQTRAAVACINPIRMFVDDIKLTVPTPITEQILTTWNKEYTDNVTKKYESPYGLGGDYRTSWEKDLDAKHSATALSTTEHTTPSRNIAVRDPITPTERAIDRIRSENEVYRSQRKAAEDEPGNLFDKYDDEEEVSDDEIMAQLSLEDMTEKEFLDMKDSIADYDAVNDEYIMKDHTRMPGSYYDSMEKVYFRKQATRRANAGVH